MRAWLSWICLAGCGRVGFGLASDAAGVADALAVDLAPPGPLVGPPLMTVDPTLLPPFSPATLVPNLSSGSDGDDDPALTRDELEIFFDSERGGDHDIYTSRRALITDPWPVPVPIAEIDTAGGEEHPFVTADALRLYFMSTRSGGQELYVASRTDRQSPWGNITVLTTLNSPTDEDMGAVSGDELTLMFSSTRPAMGTDDLYVSRRDTPLDGWSPPVQVVELTSSSYDRQPHLDDYALTLYYEQGGDAQLLWTHRATADAMWPPPQGIPELDGVTTEESDPWLSPDLRTIYFTVATINVDTSKDIYRATR